MYVGTLKLLYARVSSKPRPHVQETFPIRSQNARKMLVKRSQNARKTLKNRSPALLNIRQCLTMVSTSGLKYARQLAKTFGKAHEMLAKYS